MMKKEIELNKENFIKFINQKILKIVNMKI